MMFKHLLTTSNNATPSGRSANTDCWWVLRCNSRHTEPDDLGGNGSLGLNVRSDIKASSNCLTDHVALKLVGRKRPPDGHERCRAFRLNVFDQISSIEFLAGISTCFYMTNPPLGTPCFATHALYQAALPSPFFIL